jgi:hypothetical protein
VRVIVSLLGVGPTPVHSSGPTMLSWDCSSISKACMVRRSSEISLLPLCTSSLLVATSRFNSSVCKQDTGQGVRCPNASICSAQGPDRFLDSSHSPEHSLVMATFLTTPEPILPSHWLPTSQAQESTL